MKMNLHKALKIKNRIAGEVARLQGIVQRENSRLETSKSQVNVKEILTELSTQLRHLIEIKTAIAKANVGIYEKIVTMAEMKSQITFYQRLNTDDEDQISAYRQDGSIAVVTRRLCTINRATAESEIKNLTTHIEQTQDEIDFYNAETIIEVKE